MAYITEIIEKKSLMLETIVLLSDYLTFLHQD